MQCHDRWVVAHDYNKRPMALQVVLNQGENDEQDN